MADENAVVLIDTATGEEEIHIRMTAGDTLPAITGIVQETALTGYSILFLVQRSDGTTLSKTGTITDATKSGGGEFTVTWAASDLLAGDDQRCVLQLTDSGGGVLSYQNIFLDVAESISI